MNPRIRLSSEDITAGKKTLQESGQKEKAQLLEILRRKSQTYTRWLSSSIEDLEEELSHIRKQADYKPIVADTILEVILRKISLEKPMNYQQVSRHSLLIKESSAKAPPRIFELAKQMHSNALTSALTDGKLDVAKSLWESRIGSPSVENTLTYIALLFLNGHREEANNVCEDLRSTAQTITASSLQTASFSFFALIAHF
ncbi:unnamed protein product [Strongylus vulgaris]|uniref:Uncharacterized protein n=1 Tax=Strongylus vulgaris TaxID=40348 RepID=A0A3P7KQE3_STRVU|nr:unnamed protein product [Strongylus vulgaris]